MITAQISLYAFYAARGILALLIVLSICSIAFFIERMLFFRKNMLKNEKSLMANIKAADSLEAVRNILIQADSAETDLLLEGIDQLGIKDSFRLMVTAAYYLEKAQWERFTTFLGSVGSNAPFIGLLGTVLGILKSFADLGVAGQGGPQVVMAGISEALILTAVGLAVAIPAVIFFNICKHKIKKSSTRVEAMINLILSKDSVLKPENQANIFQSSIKLGRVS